MHSKKTVLIVDLMNAANMELIRLDFRSSALSRHDKEFRRFCNYCTENGIQTYDAETGPRYFRSRFGLNIGDANIKLNRQQLDARNTAFTEQNPARTYQLPVMFRILFNCGLRTSELLKLRMRDVDLEENVFIILDTKFHKNRLVPFSTTVAEALKEYLEKIQEKSADAFIFPSSSSRSKGGRYGNSWIQAQFRQILRIAKIPYNGSGNGPRPHDIRHTFAVHCLNNWVLSGEDITAALPVLSRYLGHNGLSGTQKYLQLTAQMYPDIVTKLELQFGALIPQMEVANENN